MSRSWCELRRTVTWQAAAILGMLFLAHVAAAQFIQQGSKLVGTGALQYPGQGFSVALSADGNTAIVGGPYDGGNETPGGPNTGTGAVWVFTRTGGVWTQQGNKLVSPDCEGYPQQGFSVALSADGNTAIEGGPYDSTYDSAGLGGAAWVFTRSGGVWTQQGDKLLSNDGEGSYLFPAYQGWSVALSADGNTAIVGGVGDSSGVGAAWVFTRSDGAWAQQGGKLVGTGAVETPLFPVFFPVDQGWSVALSADGNTAIVGGPFDNGQAGAAWVFTRLGGTWTQQGNKLVGTGAAGSAFQGASVALSADGNTAIVGGPLDNQQAGAVWVYTRSAGIWSQQGSKLVGAGAAVSANQGTSVSISGDGNTAVMGGPFDNGVVGAAWVFTRLGGTWTQQGDKLVGTGVSEMGYGATQGMSVALSADGTTVIVGGPDDSNATEYSYGIGAAWVFVAGGCTPPSITSQPQSQSIQSGQTATLSVTATGTTPLSYQWYQGDAGDTSTLVGADASTFTTAPLESTAAFWVRVANACGTADSATTTVMVTVERRVRRHLTRLSAP